MIDMNNEGRNGITQNLSTWLHKFKCLKCGLHFIVCSWYPDWPNAGTTRDQTLGEATGKCHCPECGSDEEKLRWSEERTEAHPEPFIFQVVPGKAEAVGLGRAQDTAFTDVDAFRKRAEEGEARRRGLDSAQATT